MTTCKECQIMLIERMLGKLAAPDRDRLEEHLRSCPDCLRLAGRSPEIAVRREADEDIPLPDREASWRTIADRTFGRRRARPAVFGKWAAAAAGMTAIFLLGIVAGKRLLLRPGESGLRPLAASGFTAPSPPSYFEGVELVLLSALNATGEESRSGAETRLLEDILFQTRILKQVVARRNDVRALGLIEEVEMVLVGLSNLKPGDAESRDFLNRTIRENDLKFRLKSLTGLDATL